jgi:hypothetical protein
MTKLILGIFLICFTFSLGAATLEWNENCSPDTAGYRVYLSTNSVPDATVVTPSFIDDCGITRPERTNVYYPFTESITISGKTNVSFTLTNLIPMLTYHLAVTAFDAGGLESDFSDIVNYTPPSSDGSNSPPTQPVGLEVISVVKIN